MVHCVLHAGRICIKFGKQHVLFASDTQIHNYFCIPVWRFDVKRLRQWKHMATTASYLEFNSCTSEMLFLSHHGGI
jgi:hypothetical protein